MFVFDSWAVMAKRIAEKELTDRNWDQEDEGEEVWHFSIYTLSLSNLFTFPVETLLSIGLQPCSWGPTVLQSLTTTSGVV